MPLMIISVLNIVKCKLTRFTLWNMYEIQLKGQHMIMIAVLLEDQQA